MAGGGREGEAGGGRLEGAGRPGVETRKKWKPEIRGGRPRERGNLRERLEREGTDLGGANQRRMEAGGGWRPGQSEGQRLRLEAGGGQRRRPGVTHGGWWV